MEPILMVEEELDLKELLCCFVDSKTLETLLYSQETLKELHHENFKNRYFVFIIIDLFAKSILIIKKLKNFIINIIKIVKIEW